MDRILKTTLFFLTFFVVSTTLTAYANAAVSTDSAASAGGGQKPKPPQDENILMRCVYTPTISTLATNTISTALPTTAVGFKFSLEKYNSNEIAVDSYAMNSQRQVIKQIGHAELVSPLASSITTSTKPAAILANLTVATDSPLEFMISFSDSTQDSSSRFSATVTVAALFNGDIYENIPVTCGLQQKEANANASSNLHVSSSLNAVN